MEPIEKKYLLNSIEALDDKIQKLKENEIELQDGIATISIELKWLRDRLER